MNLTEGAKLAKVSKSVDCDGNQSAEVDQAETRHAETSKASKHRLADTDANTNSR